MIRTVLDEAGSTWNNCYESICKAGPVLNGRRGSKAPPPSLDLILSLPPWPTSAEYRKRSGGWRDRRDSLEFNRNFRWEWNVTLKPFTVLGLVVERCAIEGSLIDMWNKVKLVIWNGSAWSTRLAWTDNVRVHYDEGTIWSSPEIRRSVERKTTAREEGQVLKKKREKV